MRRLFFVLCALLLTVLALGQPSPGITQGFADKTYKRIGFTGQLSDHRYRLRRWFNGLSYVGKGSGGVDVVMVGDSKTDGANTSTVLYSNVPHRVKLGLQKALNPIGTTGGYGFMAQTKASYSAGAWAAANTLGQYVCTKEANVTLNAGWWIGFTSTAYNAAAPRARYEFDGTASDALWKRSGVTSVDYVLSRSCATRFDLSTTAGSFIALGAGTNTELVASQASTDGYRKNAKLAGATLNPAQVNVVQWAPSDTSGSTFLHGLIAYNGDEDCGVRLHQLAYGGKKASDLNGDGNGLNVFYSFMTATSPSTATYSRNCKLVILNLGFNDFYFGGDKATYYTNLLALVDKFLARPSAPAVLLWCHPSPKNTVACTPTTNYATMEAAWPDLVAAMYKVCAVRDNVAIVDMWSTLGNAKAGDTGSKPGADTLGWLNSDGFHDLDGSDEYYSQQILNAILPYRS